MLHINLHVFLVVVGAQVVAVLAEINIPINRCSVQGGAALVGYVYSAIGQLRNNCYVGVVGCTVPLVIYYVAYGYYSRYGAGVYLAFTDPAQAAEAGAEVVGGVPVWYGVVAAHV